MGLFFQTVDRSAKFGSGLCRELSYRLVVAVPVASQLEDKDKSIVYLNYLSTVLRLIAGSTDGFFHYQFVNENVELVREQVLATISEVDSLLEKHGWFRDVTGEEQWGDSIVTVTQRLVEGYRERDT